MVTDDVARQAPCGPIGTPDKLVERVRDYNEVAGGFEIASLQVNFNMIGYEDAARSMKLFGATVIPHFTDAAR